MADSDGKCRIWSEGPRSRQKERREKAQHYIDLVGLQGFENHFPVKISGGMKQRVGIARAYCNEPVVMLMDEPFGHLDAQTRYLMQEDLMKIWEQEKRTVIFVTIILRRRCIWRTAYWC